MKKLKHSKFKNTGILYELLVRNLMSDVLEGKKSSNTMKLIHTYFNENTELGKELILYKVLSKPQVQYDKKRAGSLIREVLNSRKKIKINKLTEQKEELVGKIKEMFVLESFFGTRLDNYKVLASVYKLLESESTNTFYDPNDIISCKYTILEHLVKPSPQPNSRVIESLRNEPDDIKILAYRHMVEAFNSKYSGKLNERQRELVKKYLTNMTNSGQFKEWVNEQVDLIKTELTENIFKIKDKATRIKVQEAVSQIDRLKDGNSVKDDHVSSLLKFYEILEEIGEKK